MSKADETRARILRATRALVESGDPAVSMGRIAEAAGVTRQLLYVHFDGRADLLLELSRSVDREVRTPELQARIDDAPDALAALHATVVVQGEIKPRIHAVAAAIDRLRATDEDAAAAWQEREGARLARVRAVVDRLRREGDLHASWRPTDAAHLVWSSTSQHAWAALVLDAGWTTQRWVDTTSRLLHRALTTPAHAEG